MSARSFAQEATSWYLSHIDPTASNAENVKTFLRGPVLALTLKILLSPEVPPVGLELEDESVAAATATAQEEKKSSGDASETSWRKYLHRNQEENDVVVWDEQDQDAYDALDRRTQARMEAFLGGCSLALPDMSRPKKDNSKQKLPTKPVPAQPKEVSLSEALAGFRVSNKDSNNTANKSPTLASIQASKALLRQISASSASSAAVKLPQLRASDLTTRLELYIRTLHRVRTLGRECVVAAEPPRALKARANAVVNSFVATVGCVRSMGPSLTRLLECLTKELLAEEFLGESVYKVIQSKYCVDWRDIAWS